MNEEILRRITRVAKLLAKAESTNSDPEALALLEKCYRELAQVVNDLDRIAGPPAPGSRPRERRFMFDRRGSRIADKFRTETGRPDDPISALARYQRSAGSGHEDGGIIDSSV